MVLISHSRYLNNIGLIYNNAGKLDKALEFYKKALQISYEKDKTQTYSNIASIYYAKGDYNKTIYYLQKAIKINQNYGNYYALGAEYINIGGVYIKTNNLPKAKEYINKGLEMEEKIGNKRWIGTAYTELGEFYTLSEKFISSSPILIKSQRAAWAIILPKLLYGGHKCNWRSFITSFSQVCHDLEDFNYLKHTFAKTQSNQMLAGNLRLWMKK